MDSGIGIDINKVIGGGESKLRGIGVDKTIWLIENMGAGEHEKINEKELEYFFHDLAISNSSKVKDPRIDRGAGR